MEHPCYRCQASIEEGTAFCPHCGAPQIRVIVPEDSTGDSSSGNTVIGESSTTTMPPSTWATSASTDLSRPGAIQWRLAWQGALLAGAIAAVLTAIPFVALGCFLWMMLAGALAVALYQKRVPRAVISSGMGMKLGAVAGIFGFAINAVMTIGSFLLLRTSGDLRRALQEQMERSLSNNSDPKVQQMMQQLMEFMSTPQGIAVLMVITLMTLAVLFLLFTAAGGALGASFFGRRRELR